MTFSSEPRLGLEQIVCECGEYAWGADNMFDCVCGNKYRSLEHWMFMGRLDLYIKGAFSRSEFEKRIDKWSTNKRCVDKGFCQFCTKRNDCLFYRPIEMRGKKQGLLKRKSDQTFRFDGNRYLRTKCEFVLDANSNKKLLYSFFKFYRDWKEPVRAVEIAVEKADKETNITTEGHYSGDKATRKPGWWWIDAICEVVKTSGLRFAEEIVINEKYTYLSTLKPISFIYDIGFMIDGKKISVKKLGLWEFLNSKDFDGELVLEWNS